MSLQHSPEGTIDRKVLVAVSGAIRSIETVTGTIGYAGLDELDVSDGDIIGTVFMEDWQLKESVSKQWFHMKPETLIKRLTAYL